ncbi:hypothetical protein CWC05_07280 [Pseudoalteromonas ruthenica]|uniref:Uncharacterized protein n=2 Tax=Pseudoalteromonas ruthenica TaxID=151081 RepID=A0A5S3Z5X2_9GAMM|nr:hypothetical protein [Pseudoalteromonas ruthenica]TMP87649.1 hypothetical protein CWC05_07280 [Pseudoalteromonas ruthenica]
MKLSKELYAIASSIAHETDGFFDTKGPGAGNLSTNQFIDLVRSSAEQAFGEDYSEQKICGDNSMAVDFYFPEEQTVVEIALGIKNPNTEFEKDILKALMARSLGNKIRNLVFICKPGGYKKCNQPGRKAMIEWLQNQNGMTLEVWDL